MKKAEDVAGWMARNELDTIRAIAAKHQPTVVVEIGSFAGRSALAWAEALPDSTIFCVDLFAGDFIATVSLTGNLLDPDLTVAERARPLYSLFLENTWDCPNIRHIRCDSKQLLAHWHGDDVDLVFIDGHHSFESVAGDLATAMELGADVICGHDYGSPGYGGPEHKGVTAAVDKFRSEHDCRFFRHRSTTIFELEL
jgi:hypothetical protein